MRRAGVGPARERDGSYSIFQAGSEAKIAPDDGQSVSCSVNLLTCSGVRACVLAEGAGGYVTDNAHAARTGCGVAMLMLMDRD